LQSTIDEIQKRMESKQQTGSSFVNDYMQLQLVKQMMKELKQEEEIEEPFSKRIPGEVPVTPTMPLMPHRDDSNAVLDALKVAKEMFSGMFQQPQPQLTMKDVLEMTNQMYSHMQSMSENLRTEMKEITRSLQETIQSLGQRQQTDPQLTITLERLNDRISRMEEELRMPKGERTGGLMGLAEDLRAVTGVAQMLGYTPAGGQQQGGFTTLLEKAPQVINSITKLLDSAAKLPEAQRRKALRAVNESSIRKQLGEGETEKTIKQVEEQQVEAPSQDIESVIQKFNTAIAKALEKGDEKSIINAVRYIARKSAKIPQLEPIITVFSQASKKQLKDYLTQYLTTLLQAQIPSEMVDKVVNVIDANRDIILKDAGKVASS